MKKMHIDFVIKVKDQKEMWKIFEDAEMAVKDEEDGIYDFTDYWDDLIDVDYLGKLYKQVGTEEKEITFEAYDDEPEITTTVVDPVWEAYDGCYAAIRTQSQEVRDLFDDYVSDVETGEKWAGD